MDWKGACHSVVMAGEGQPPTSTIAGNHDPLCMQGLVQSAQLPRRCGEVETPMSNQPPRGTQGRRLLGPAALHTCPFPSLHGQVRARLGPGGYCRCSGNGGPQTCLPTAHGVAVLAGLYAIFINKAFKTLARGQASRGGRRKTSSGAASPGKANLARFP